MKDTHATQREISALWSSVNALQRQVQELTYDNIHLTSKMGLMRNSVTVAERFVPIPKPPKPKSLFKRILLMIANA